MEERFRQIQRSYRSIGSSNNNPRYPIHAVDAGIPLRHPPPPPPPHHHHHAPPPLLANQGHALVFDDRTAGGVAALQRSARVPLEPWDRDAIIAYRNRVNANSRDLDFEGEEIYRHGPGHRNGSLQMGRERERERERERGRRALLLEEEEKKAEAERVRWARLRDIPSFRTMVRRNQEFRDWPPAPLRDREHDIHPQSQLQPQSQVLGRPHPHPPPHQHQSPTRSATLEQKIFRYGLEKRNREEEEDELQSPFHIRKRVTFQEMAVANDGHYHSQSQWTAAAGDEHEHEHDRSPYSPPLPPQRGATYFPSPPAQPRVRWHHDLFEPEEHTQNKMLGAIPRERDSLSSPHLGRLREISGSIRSQHHHQHLHPPPPPLSSIRTVDEDNMQMRKERESGFPKGLVENRHTPLPVKDLLLPSTTGIGIGPQQHQLEARKGMMQVQIKGRNVGIVAGQSKKQKSKISSWGAQTSKAKGKLKSNPHSLPNTSLAPGNEGKMLSQNELQEPTSQEEQSTHISDAGMWNRLDYAKYERSMDTADLSVVFKPSGMIAQEVVTSIDNNWPDYTRTNSSGSKEPIQVHSLLEQDIEEEGEIRSIESQSTLMEKNVLTDNHNAGSQSKNMSMTLISESITSEGRSCYLDDLDNKTKASAFGSQETGVPLGKHLPLDCWKIGSPAPLKTNQSEEKPPMVVSLPTCTTSLKMENDLFLSAPPEPKPSSEEMQEIASKVPSNYTGTDGSDLKERPKKKLKVEKTENPALNQNEEMDNPLLTSSGLHGGTEVIELQGPSVRVQELPTRTLTANVSQQLSGAYPIQSLQPDTKSSQNAIFLSTLPQSRPSIIGSSMRTKAIASSGRATRSRTWHRTNNATSSFVLARPSVIHNDATSARQAVAKVENSQSAPYVRKGNSLVRAPCPPSGLSSLKSNFSGPLHIGKASIQKSSPLKGVVAAEDTHNLIAGNVCSNTRNSLTAVRLSTPALERPTTPPLLRTVQSPPCITGSPQTFVPAVVSVTPTEVQVLTMEAPPSDAFKVNNENISIDNQGMSDPSNNLSVCKSNLNEDHIENAGIAQMIYVKRKSNQLIAASTSKSQGSTACLGESGQSPLNCLVQERYYKRKKNQLVRSGLATESKITKVSEVPGARSSLDMELKVPMLKAQREMTFFQTKLGRVLKQKKHSWVWTLGKAESSRVPLLQSRHVASSLFPWKRPSYGRSGLVGKIKAVPSISKGSSLSLISKKLKCLRKRDTVYTKSLNGFSLHRSGVLSIGGSNLKWTKSLEKRSKQASEEATMAVAAAEKKRREVEDSKKKKDKRSSKPAQGIKLRARKSIGERIVHVGLFRYRMDPSKRTLQMITAEESTSSISTSHGCRTNDTSKLSTPRRVSIGGDEYLRVGNGNQLVRDPKKVCRVLASEKVRWSLHTARHRLAKKQQYCQFFTRFGKCNKEDGKCSYIHDREKVAVCTKFLKGICSNENCELTHKIIPERMEDCSYFLQGFCTNENCPYRHVNVNPKAPVCDGFLKGYCAEGDKCNKKHTYVCPRYAAKGECADRSTCKLHHPKKKDKPKISRRRKGGTNAKRRYFVPEDLGINELASALLRLNSELHPTQKTTLELPSRAPECLDFISLDGPEEDASDSDLIRGAVPSMKIRESDFLSNLGLPDDDIDMMIKPIHLLRKGQAVSI